MKSVTESTLLDLQRGFRSGRSTTEQITTLHFLLDVSRTQKRSLTDIFVDYGKAFDSVDRRAIRVVLRHYSVPDADVADVMQLYHGSIAAVSTRFGLAEMFYTTSGALQWSPHIFILLVDYILRQSLVNDEGFTPKSADGRRHPPSPWLLLHMLIMLRLPGTPPAVLKELYTGFNFN